MKQPQTARMALGRLGWALASGLWVGLVSLTWVLPAQAHLMVAQQGTLNLVGDGAYLVASLPVSALQGVDDNGDGLLSLAEMRAHAGAIEAQVRRGIRLSDPHGVRSLDGLMLNLAQRDDAPLAPVTHLIVLGRYALADPALPLRLHHDLYGLSEPERRLEYTVTRGADREKLVMRPGHEEAALLQPAWTQGLRYALLGTEHVLGGADHLLFLLVVLAAGMRLRQTVRALSCFTAGHATTLAASVLGGLSVPGSLVEPAIAATIVGMALYDRWSASRATAAPMAWRLALVYACALIHGLGLAEALRDLDPGHRLAGLAGFNLGVEAAQVAVALGGAAALAAWRRLARGFAPMRWTRWHGLASRLGLVAGSVWLVQRAALGLSG